jgi:hypothetical protein
MTIATPKAQTTVLLKVPFVSPDKVEDAGLPRHAICFQLWSAASFPDITANFSISHANGGIHIHYTVCEPFLKSKSRKPNDDVHKDNCVEFFIAFNNEDCYYNFEFNCLGSVKGGFGNNRADRKPLPVEILKRIEDQVSVSISNLHESKFIQWEASVIIPKEAFDHHNLQSLSGLTCYCNFTKCGDDLPVPHYLSWVHIPGQVPDFHQPLFFGKVQFE